MPAPEDQRSGWQVESEISSASISPDLDVGCGTGIASRPMAERGAKVLGVELAPNGRDCPPPQNLRGDWRLRGALA